MACGGRSGHVQVTGEYADAVFKHAKLLDQVCDGLKKTMIYPLIVQFPHLFEPLFTFCGVVGREDVINALYIEEDHDMTPFSVPTLWSLMMKVGSVTICELVLDSLLAHCHYISLLYP